MTPTGSGRVQPCVAGGMRGCLATPGGDPGRLRYVNPRPVYRGSAPVRGRQPYRCDSPNPPVFPEVQVRSATRMRASYGARVASVAILKRTPRRNGASASFCNAVTGATADRFPRETRGPTRRTRLVSRAAGDVWSRGGNRSRPSRCGSYRMSADRRWAAWGRRR